MTSATPDPTPPEPADASHDTCDRCGRPLTDRPCGIPHALERDARDAEAAGAMRRFTITIPGDTAEAVQFSNGVIAAFWLEEGQPYLWLNVAALREQWPDAELTWIDEEVPGA